MSRKRSIPSGEFTATIHSLSHEGRGITTIDGKTVFIDNALPGETVKFQYTYSKSSYAEGKAIEIANPSSDRVPARCPHFGICGGCSLQHMSSTAQIQHKQATLLNLLEHFGKTQPKTILPAITAEAWGYRGKARLGAKFVFNKGGAMVGFREKYSSYIADIKHCDILHPSVGYSLQTMRNLINQLSQPNSIPQIEVACGDQTTALIVRHMSELTEQDETLLKAFAEEHQFTIYLQPKGVDSVHILGDKNNCPDLYYTIPDYQVTIHFHPCDFTQVNQAINLKMINKALELLSLEKTDKVLDLFCGLGNFTLPIAKHCEKVIGVEGSHSMTKKAAMNAARNNILNTEFYGFDLTQSICAEPWANQQYDKLLIDPPRTGAEEMMRIIERFGAKKIVYVSCNPATLARDTQILTQEKGYQLSAAGVLDMFPHTNHVESIALFVKE